MKEINDEINDEIYNEIDNEIMEGLRTGKIVDDKGLRYHLRFDDATYSLSYPLCGRNESLECIEIPNEVNGKPVTSFSNLLLKGDCTANLKTLIIGRNVTEIDSYAFSIILDKHINVIIDSDNPAYMYRDGGFYSKDGKILYKVRCEGTTFHIPEGVTDVAVNAFFGCKTLTALIIPTSVKRLGHGIFPWTNTWFTIFYKGSKADWANLDIDKTNEVALTKSTIYYYSETPSGDSWCYAADGITPEITHTSFLTKLIVKFNLKVKFRNIKDSYKKQKEKK